MRTLKLFDTTQICLPVLRRRAGETLIDLIGFWGEVMVKRGHPSSWDHGFPNQRAYHNAVSRLRRAGLIAARRTGGRTPLLALTERGLSRVSPELNPRRFWDRKWCGHWYVLAYDIPEKDRRYRDILRAFLTRLRMGCLQRSVWVSANDIRPEYDDLCKAASVMDFADLFRCPSVYGRAQGDVALRAWPFDRIREAHLWYCAEVERTLENIDRGEIQPAAVRQLEREAMTAYLAVMKDDPLLPRVLWPPQYLGPKVHDLHRQLATRLATYRPDSRSTS